MPDWAPVEHDPFAAPLRAPRLSLTIQPGAPPPQTQPDAPRVPSGTNWTPIDHEPDFNTEAPKEEPIERPGFLESAKNAAETFDVDFHNQRAAASQGTTPNVAAHKENLISDNVVEGDDGNLHYIDADGRLQPTDTNKHVALRDPVDKKIKVYARTAGTDEGRLSSAGRLMMSGMQTETPRFGVEGIASGLRALGIGSRGSRVPAVHPAWLPPSSTGEAIEAAGRIGVDIPHAIASENKNVNFLGQVMAKAPGGAPLHTAIDEGLQGADRGLAGALRRTGASSGGIADAKQAGEGVTTGLENVFKPESQKLVGQLYERVDKLVDPAKTAPLTETQKTVGDILARRQARGNTELGAAVDTVSGALQRRGGLTYEALKDLRTEVRELKDKGQKGGLLPPGMSQRELESIYTALTKDLGNATEVTGGPAARVAWERANQLSADRKEVLEVLNKVIGSKSRSDEGVMDALERMAKTGAGADIETLSNARKALQGIPGHLPGSPGAWENVAATVVSRLGKDSQGKFSPNLFVRDYNDLSPAGKRMLFHGVGKGDMIGALDDIATVSDKYVKAGKLANSSGTAGHGTLLAALTGAAASLAHGDILTPIGIGAGIIGSNVMSRMLGNPATAASVARWSRAVDNLAQTPGYRTWAAYNIASRNLANTTAAMGGDPSLAPNITQKLQGAMRRPDERQD